MYNRNPLLYTWEYVLPLPIGSSISIQLRILSGEKNTLLINWPVHVGWTDYIQNFKSAKRAYVTIFAEIYGSFFLPVCITYFSIYYYLLKEYIYIFLLVYTIFLELVTVYIFKYIYTILFVSSSIYVLTTCCFFSQYQYTAIFKYILFFKSVTVYTFFI